MYKSNRIPVLRGKSRFALEHWYQSLYRAGLLFNPDDAPEDIVFTETDEPVFTSDECLTLREGIQFLFDHHGDRVYEVALKYTYKAMGLREEDSGLVRTPTF